MYQRKTVDRRDIMTNYGLYPSIVGANGNDKYLLHYYE